MVCVPMAASGSGALADVPMHRVVVVGGGLAGLAATLQVLEDSEVVEVVLVEKEGKLGGNSAKASSGISALTPAEGDENDTYTRDTLESGGGRSRPELVAQLVGNSADAISFLESHGVDLSKVTQLGGHSVKRTHSNPAGPNVGFVLVKALSTAVLESPRVKVLTGAEVKSLQYVDGEVVGINYVGPLLEPAGEEAVGDGEHLLQADVVILASGGFGANHDMLMSHNPDLKGFATTNGAWATGDGMRIGEQAGGELVDMDQVQVHPTGFVNPKDPDAGTKFLAPEKLRGVGGVLLNKDGKRFVNELARRDHVTDHMLKQDGKVAWLLLGDDEAKDFGEGSLDFYAGKAGIATKAESYEGAAAAMGVSAEVLKAELEQYALVAAGKQADAFGKTVFPHGGINPAGVMYVMKVTPVIHYTMGGLAIDSRAQVLGKSGEPIPNLLAAGEVTGGVHGANRLAGNSLLDCTVFGRIAGKQAAELVRQHSAPLREEL